MPLDGGSRAHRRLGATLYNARMNRLPIALLLALACSVPTAPAMAGVPSTPPPAAGSAVDPGAAPLTPPADADQAAQPVAPPTVAPATSPAATPADDTATAGSIATAQDPASATTQDQRTQAEKDYDALY